MTASLSVIICSISSQEQQASGMAVLLLERNIHRAGCFVKNKMTREQKKAASPAFKPVFPAFSSPGIWPA